MKLARRRRHPSLAVVKPSVKGPDMFKVNLSQSRFKVSPSPAPVQSPAPCPGCPVCRADPQEILAMILPDLAALQGNRADQGGPGSPAYQLLLKVVAAAVGRLAEEDSPWPRP